MVWQVTNALNEAESARHKIPYAFIQHLLQAPAALEGLHSSLKAVPSASPLLEAIGSDRQCWFISRGCGHMLPVIFFSSEIRVSAARGLYAVVTRPLRPYRCSGRGGQAASRWDLDSCSRRLRASPGSSSSSSCELKQRERGRSRVICAPDARAQPQRHRGLRGAARWRMPAEHPEKVQLCSRPHHTFRSSPACAATDA